MFNVDLNNNYFSENNLFSYGKNNLESEREIFLMKENESSQENSLNQNKVHQESIPKFKQSNQLKVIDEPEISWNFLKKTVTNWSNIAKDKKKKSKQAFSKDNNLLKDDITKLETSYGICIGMRMEFVFKRQKDSSVSWNKVLTCRNANDEIQAIACYSENKGKYKLAWLATNPENINCAVNASSSQKIRGAGTRIIQYLLQKMIDSNGSFLALEACENAIPFYKGLNFSQYNPKCNKHINTSMKLSLEAAKELFKNL